MSLYTTILFMIERCFETNIVSWNEQSRFSSELLVRHFSIKNINVITIYDYFSTFTDKSLLDYFILRFQFFCRKVCSLELRLWFFSWVSMVYQMEKLEDRISPSNLVIVLRSWLCARDQFWLQLLSLHRKKFFSADIFHGFKSKSINIISTSSLIACAMNASERKTRKIPFIRFQWLNRSEECITPWLVLVSSDYEAQ